MNGEQSAVRAFHSFWSRPNRLRHQGRIDIPDYELLTLILSALQWRRLNGPIVMITDSDGADWLEANGLAALWSEPPDRALDAIGPEIDPFLFWAAGKLCALDRVDAPCVMLDTDMIIWEDIRPRLRETPVAAHREALNGDVYPDPRVFRLRPGYRFPADWDFGLDAANTAFLYLPDDALRRTYIREALAFMAALEPSDLHPTVTMCFAEQRILPMCARAMGTPLAWLLDDRALNAQTFVTHLWGYKNTLAASPEAREAFCRGCARRIALDDPAWAEPLRRHPRLGRYLEE